MSDAPDAQSAGLTALHIHQVKDKMQSKRISFLNSFYTVLQLPITVSILTQLKHSETVLISESIKCVSLVPLNS